MAERPCHHNQNRHRCRTALTFEANLWIPPWRLFKRPSTDTIALQTFGGVSSSLLQRWWSILRWSFCLWRNRFPILHLNTKRVQCQKRFVTEWSKRNFHKTFFLYSVWKVAMMVVDSHSSGDLFRRVYDRSLGKRKGESIPASIFVIFPFFVSIRSRWLSFLFWNLQTNICIRKTDLSVPVQVLISIYNVISIEQRRRANVE